MARSILSTAMLRLAGSETFGGHHRVRGFKGATETVRRIVEEGSPSVGEQYMLIVVMYCHGTGSELDELDHTAGGFPMAGGPAPPVSKGRRVLARVLQVGTTHVHRACEVAWTSQCKPSTMFSDY